MAVVSGGTTLIDNGTLDAGVPTGSLILISTQTASSSASISFTSGIDSTYDSYIFKFINIHPSTDNTYFTFQTSTDGGSNYNTTTTSACFKAFRSEASGTTEGLNYEFGYRADSDQAQGTAFQRLHGDGGIGNDNDQNGAFNLQIFNPSSTNFVKHYIITASVSTAPDYFVNSYVAGYFNTTSAINAIQFKMSSGNIDSGIIKMYGVK